MRFNFDAYDKVYPVQTESTAPIESAVDTFKPTENEKAMDDKPGDDVMNADPTPKDEPPTEHAEIPAEGVKDE